MSIKEKPYQTICNFYEKKYPNAGRKIFRKASLVPASPLLPKIVTKGGKSISPALHLMLVGNSGSCKSQALKEIEKIGYNTEIKKSITKSDLQHMMAQFTRGVLMFNDLKENLQTEGFEKVFEGIVDGHIKKETTRSKIDVDVVVSTVSAGVISDIMKKKIFSGFLPRMIPIFLLYEVEEQKEVVNNITNQVIGKTEYNTSVSEIKDYYFELRKVQKKLSDYPRINDAFFDDKGVKKLNYRFNDLLDEIGGNSKYYFRDFYYGLKFAYNHAFLNYFNRLEEGNVKDNTLKVTAKDIEIGGELMEEQLRKKDALMSRPKARKELEKMVE